MEPFYKSIMVSDNMQRSVSQSFRWLYQFCRFSITQFFEQNGLQIASSLAYATLLSLVPLLTVMFGFLGGLPVFKEMSAEIQTFVFNNFVPSFGDSIQNYLIEFSSKASKLTFTGTIVLLFIALMLMATIDNAFNRIWKVKEKRNPIARFLVYWAILTLGPLLIGVGLVSTSYFLSIPAIDSVYASFGIKVTLLQIMPFLTTSIAFTIIYLLIPNCYVPKKYALMSGIFSAMLFELAKYGFGAYVKAIPTYQQIYGAIAIIPMFLLWIYLSWVIILLGAHMCYCLSNFHLDENGNPAGRNDWDFVDVYKIIAALWQAQRNGNGLNMMQIRKNGVKLSQDRITEILHELTNAKWVNRLNSGVYILTRDLSEATVQELYEILPCKFYADNFIHENDKTEQSIKNVLNDYKNNVSQSLNIPLRNLLVSIEN